MSVKNGMSSSILYCLFCIVYFVYVYNVLNKIKSTIMNSNSPQPVFVGETLQVIATKSRGRTAVISDTEVIRAGEELESKGQRVTGYLIRAVFSGVGRTDRYSDVWDRHVASRTAAAAEGEGEVTPTLALPAEIRTAIESGQSQIGAVLETLSTVAIKHAKNEAADRIADADKRTAEAEEERSVIQEAGESAMDKAQGEIEILTGQLDLATAAAQASEGRAKQAEGVAADREVKLRAAQDAERLAHDTVTRLNTKLEEETARVDALNSIVTGLRTKLGDIERTAIQAESLASARLENIEKLEETVAGMKAAIQQEISRSDAAQHRADDAQARADAANKRADEELARAREVDQTLLATQARADAAGMRADEALACASETEQKLLAGNQQTEKYLAQLGQLEATVLALKAQLESVPVTILESNS